MGSVGCFCGALGIGLGFGSFIVWRDIGDEEAPGEAHLGGRQADARGIVHEFDHFLGDRDDLGGWFDLGSFGSENLGGVANYRE